MHDNPSEISQPENTQIKLGGIFNPALGSSFDYSSIDMHLKLEVGIDRVVKLTISDNDNVTPDSIITGILDAEDDLFFEEMTVD